MKFKILLIGGCLYAINNNTMQQGNKLIRPVLTTGMNAMKGGLSSGAPLYGLHSHYRVADKVKSVKDFNEFLSSPDNIKKMKKMSRDELFDMFYSKDIKDEEFGFFMFIIGNLFDKDNFETRLLDQYYRIDYLASLDYTALKNLYEITNISEAKEFLIKASHFKAIANKYPHLFDQSASFEKINENLIELLNDHVILEKYPVDFLEYLLKYVYVKHILNDFNHKVTYTIELGKIDTMSLVRLLGDISELKSLSEDKILLAGNQISFRDVIANRNLLSTPLMKKIFHNSKISIEKYQQCADHISQLLLQEGNPFPFGFGFFKSNEEIIQRNLHSKISSDYLEKEFDKFLNK